MSYTQHIMQILHQNVRRLCGVIVLAGVFFVMSMSLVSAQVSVSGTLYESDGTTAVSGATIKVAVATSTPGVYSATTNGSGAFTISGIATGTHSVATTSWVTQSGMTNEEWREVTYGNGRFVAVSCGVAVGSGCTTNIDNRLAYSSNGESWTMASMVGNNDAWRGVTYGNGLFVAVSSNGDRIATSPDGITWTARTAPEDNSWRGVTYGNGRFVAVAAGTGTTSNNTAGARVMYSSDGTTWATTTAAGNNDQWRAVTYGNGLFVAVGCGFEGTCSVGGDRIMTSSDGITWTAQSVLGNDDRWEDVTYGNGIFMAVGVVGDRVATSPNGTTWTARTPFVDAAGSLVSVAYSNGAFIVGRCRVGGSATCSSGAGNRLSRTTNNGVTWQEFYASNQTPWSQTFGNGRHVVLNSNTISLYSRTPFLDSIPLTVYVDNNTRKAAAVSYIGTSTSALSGITLRDGTVSLKHAQSGGVINVANGDYYDRDNDTDIPFTANTATTTIGVSGRPASLTITSGTTLLAPQNLQVYGDLTQSGSFRAERGTTYLLGTSTQTVKGSLKTTNGFYGLTITNTTGSGNSSQSISFASSTDTTGTLTMNASTSAKFNAGSTFSFQNVSLTGGGASSRVWLRSSTAGSRWYIDVPGTQTSLTYLNVRDSAATTTLTTTNSTSAGNNVNWYFGPAGSSTISNHDATQVNDAFNHQNKTNEALFAFKLTPNSGAATTTRLILSLTGVENVNSSDFSSIRLFRDLDNDASYDVTDTQVGGAGVMSITNGQGTITFSTAFPISAAQNFVVIANWNYPQNGSYMKISLPTSNITIEDLNGPQNVYGSVSTVQHNRNNRGGGGSAVEDIGGAPPAGDTPQTGGGSGGGEQIGNDPNFRRPTTNTGENWTNPENAYNQVNNSYATRGSFDAGEENIFAGIGYAVPGNNQIVGIEVRLEASATENDGSTLAARLTSAGIELGDTKTTPSLTTSDAVISLGGPSDTWGRSWTVAEANAIGLRISPGSIGLSTQIRLDEIQVRVYFQATGGGGGGGADI